MKKIISLAILVGMLLLSGVAADVLPTTISKACAVADNIDSIVIEITDCSTYVPVVSTQVSYVYTLVSSTQGSWTLTLKSSTTGEERVRIICGPDQSVEDLMWVGIVGDDDCGME